MGTVYKMALSSTELSNVYSHPCDAPDTTNLKLWLPLKTYYTSLSHSGYAEGSYPGSTIKDYSKYGATGTYVKNTSRPYDIAWDWTFDTTCFVNGTAVCQWKDYKVADGYRFAFNGKEKDDETYGEGDEYDYGVRMYDARIGRFMSVDLLTGKYPWYTPYQFAGNKPIWAVDLDGKEELLTQEKLSDTKGWKLVISILNSTKIFKKFLTKLASQQKYNVLLMQSTFKDVNDARSSSVSFSNMEELKKDKVVYEGLSKHDLDRIEKTTFAKKKRLLVTEIRNDFVSRVGELSETYRPASCPVCINLETFEEFKKALAYLSFNVIHELVAHQLNNINRKLGSTTTPDERYKNADKDHGQFNGDATWGSPDHEDILNNKKYEKTPAHEALHEIYKAVNEKYDRGNNKDKKKDSE